MTRPRVVLALTPLTEREVEPLLFDPSDPPLDLLASVVEADELARAVKEEQRVDAVLLSPELSGLSRLTASACAPRAYASSGSHSISASENHSTRWKSIPASTAPSPARSCSAPSGRRHDRRESPCRGATRHAGAERREDRGGERLGGHRREGRPRLKRVRGIARGARRAPLAHAAHRGRCARRQPRTPSRSRPQQRVDPRRHPSDTGRRRALRELVERWTYEPEGWPSVLLGAPDPRALIDLAQPGAMTRALDALAGLYPLVVCDVGFPIEDARSAHLHREALIAADSVILVLGAREPQLHAGLRQLDIILTELGIRSERLRIIVNAVGGPSRREKGTITATIAEHLTERDLTVDAWLPWDARGLRRSEQHGKPIALAPAAARSPTRSRACWTSCSCPQRAHDAKRRKRRLTAPPGNTPSAEREEVAWATRAPRRQRPTATRPRRSGNESNTR